MYYIYNSKKKITIITIIVVLVIILLLIGGYLIYRQIDLKAPIKEDWANIYYNYLKENKGTDKLPGNSKIGFIDVEDLETPSMALSHEEDGKTYTDIYYIDNGKVQYINIPEPTYLVYVYNIQIKKYGWYAYSKNESFTSYIRILELILKDNSQNSETENNIDITDYKFENGDVLSATSLDGETKTISKEDTSFINTNFELGLIDYRNDMTDRQLKNAVLEGMEKYKSEEQIQTDELKNVVSQKETEISNTQEEIKEIEKKSEEMKITQNNVLSKVGEHLKYFTGCYRGSTYGIYDLYSLKVSETNVPGIDPVNEMAYEVVGLNSISTLNINLKKYMTDDVISKLKNSSNGDITKNLHEYNGKVYFGIGGIGDGSYIKYQDASVVNSEGETSVVQLLERGAFENEIISKINVTIKYDLDSSSYRITDYSVTN